LDHGADARIDAGEVDAWLVGAKAEVPGGADLVGTLGGGGQRLGRQCAPIVRNAAKLSGLNQHDAQPARNSALGGRDPGRTGPNDAKIDPVALRHAPALNLWP
jgi:hypothetical protein